MSTFVYTYTAINIEQTVIMKRESEARRNYA